MADRVDDLRARLDGLGEELADLALDALRRAADVTVADAAERDRLVAEERRLTRARRAVEKASILLGGDRSGTFEP